MTLDPGVLAWLLTAEVLYVRAVSVLAARGVAVPRRQQAAWHVGIALQAVGLLSPVDAYGDDLLSAHMLQHLLIADLAAPLLLAGLRMPVLVFLLPRPVLVPLARRRGLRRLLSRLRRPLVALPIYMLLLYFWHVGFAFEAAITSDALHALQHASFIAIGVLVWWPALEPNRRRMPGGLWKIGHMLAARLIGMFLGMAFVLIRVPVYTGVYGDGERALGLDPLADQQIAGALMVVTDIALMFGILVFFFVQAAREHDREGAARGPDRGGDARDHDRERTSRGSDRGGVAREHDREGAAPEPDREGAALEQDRNGFARGRDLQGAPQPQAASADRPASSTRTGPGVTRR